MRTQNIIATLSFLFISIVGFAQTKGQKKETIKVWGECGMCKKTIETAAKKAGATTATWSEDTKVLTVAYAPAKTNAQKIQQSIAAAGYDTQDMTADDAAYDKLHGCCKYDRKAEEKSATDSTQQHAGHH